MRNFRKLKRGASNKRLAFALSLVLLLSMLLSSCEEKRSAYEIMEEFRRSYGIERTVFSPEIPEGEAGFCGEGFLERAFGNVSENVGDYALLFISDLDAVGEIDILVCYSAYDAAAVSESALMRLDFLRREAGDADTEYLETAFVERRGRTVILSALPDNERAMRVLDKIL